MARVCVFCASSTLDERWHQLARDLGSAMAARGDELVYGGTTTGLMGELATAARTAGGRVVGVLPTSMRQLWSVDERCDELVLVDGLGARKAEMLRGTDRVVVLAGGLGTLDELLEAMTFRQLGLVPASIDLVLLDPDGFWDPLLRQLELMADAGSVRATNARLRVARSVGEALGTA